jgi:broad specificity phosphatase PhoE
LAASNIRTDLGRKQAELLGGSLKEMGFEGEIYSSPYFRAVETAQVIADVTDRVVVPAAEMREYVIRENQMDGFQGATQDELIAGYSSVTKATDFPYPWWTSNVESDEDIEARVAPLVDRVLAADVDALLVGHGASAKGVHRYLLRRHAPDHMNHGQNIWNCFLSSFKIRPDFHVLRIMDVGHLPDDAVTSNARSRAEVLAERES